MWFSLLFLWTDDTVICILSEDKKHIFKTCIDSDCIMRKNISRP